MNLFTKHSGTTAPQASAATLAKIKERYGFVPNLAAYVAESPQVLGAVLSLVGAFDTVSLTPQEQQIVMLTVSALHGCGYYRTVHTGLGRAANIDDATLKAVVALEPLSDEKLNALGKFTCKVVEQRGQVTQRDIEDFLSAGYTKAQIFEVILGVALKSLTNYCNHVAGAEPNDEFIAMAAGQAAA